MAKKEENIAGITYDGEKPATVPFFVFESEITRAEKRFKKMFIALVISIVCILLSNAAWLCYESLYDTITYDQDGQGLNNINTGTQGDLYGAESESEDTAEQK